MSEHWYTTRELAETWNVSRSMVHKLITTHKLSALKLGDVWRIRERDKQQYRTSIRRRSTQQGRAVMVRRFS